MAPLAVPHLPHAPTHLDCTYRRQSNLCRVARWHPMLHRKSHDGRAMRTSRTCQCLFGVGTERNYGHKYTQYGMQWAIANWNSMKMHATQNYAQQCKNGAIPKPLQLPLLLKVQIERSIKTTRHQASTCQVVILGQIKINYAARHGLGQIELIANWKRSK